MCTSAYKIRFAPSSPATLADPAILAKTSASSSALCKRYGVDNSHRDLHGALLDAQILADVYLAMTGGQALAWH